MAEVSQRRAALLPTLRRVAALGLPTFALGLLLSWATSAGQHRPDFALLLAILALALLAPRWPDQHPRVEYLLRAGTGFAVALILGLTLLRQRQVADAAVTLSLFLLLVVGISVVLQVALGPRVALGVLLAALAVLAGLGLARGTDAGQALGGALRTPTPWVLFALVAVGVGLLARLERRWFQVAVYALAIAGLASYWQWGGPIAGLGAIPVGLTPLELRAASLLPAFILIGGAAQVLLALLLPRAPWRRAAQADLCAHLLLIGLPIVAATLPLRLRSPLEDFNRVAWLAWFPIVLLLARLVVAAWLLLRAASATPGEETELPRGHNLRLALAFCLICWAAYWPAIVWRTASFGLVGDEPQYLAATMSLWNGHNLELADSIFSPEMTALLAYPDQERDLHAYEDPSADRMLFSRSFGAPRGTFFLPFVAAPDLASTIELVNSGLESAGGEVVFRDAGGAVVQRQAVVVAPGRTLIVPSPPNPSGPLSATVNVGKPVVVAARAQTRDGSIETSYGAVVTGRHCLPFQLDPARWQAQIFVQNGLPAGDEATWIRYGPDGAVRDRGTLTIPPDGTGILPVAPSAEPGTICLTAGGSVAATLVARSSPGLLIQQSNPAQVARIDIPARHTTLGYFGQRLVLIHNTSADTIHLALDRVGGPVGQELAIVAHGTLAYGATDGSATITSQDPVIVSVVETIGLNAAAVTPGQDAAESLLIPVVGVGQNYYATSQLELTNRGQGDIQANAVLLDGNGQTIWRDNIWVPAGTTVSRQFWYKAAESRYLTIESRGPLTASLLQHEMHTTRPSHGLGLSLALLPGYALAGYQGALATVALFAALLALALYGLLRRIGLDARVALVVAGIVALSSPLSPAAVRLYAEVGGTLLIVLGLCCVDNWRVGRWPVYIAAPLSLACLGGALLFHARLLPLVLVVIAAAGLLVLSRLLRGVAGWSWRFWLLYGGLALGGGLLLSVLLAISTKVEPRLSPAYLRSFLEFSRVGPQTLGILFDRASGLFPAVPVLLLAGGGFAAAIRRAPFLGCTALALCLVQFGAIVLREGGWETWGPPGRYILPAVPFLAVGLGAAWCWGFARPVRLLAALLAVIGLLVTAFTWWLPLGLHYGVEFPQGYWFADDTLPPLLGMNPLRLFPALSSVIISPWRDLYPWLALLALGTLLGFPWHRLGRWGTAERPLPAAAAATLPGAGRVGADAALRSE